MENNMYNGQQESVPQQQIIAQDQPVYSQTQDDAAARKKKANTLCFISLGLSLTPLVLTILMVSINIATSGENVLEGLLGKLISSLYGGSYIGSWVTMIIARVKYKESVFAKVLMWVYIGIAILGVIAFIVLMVMCINTLRSCPD